MDKYVIRTKRKSEQKEESPVKRNKTDSDSIITERHITAAGTRIEWREIRNENLNCDYCRFLSRSEADSLLKECENSLTYNTGDLAKVHIYGKWLDIPRQQVNA